MLKKKNTYHFDERLLEEMIKEYGSDIYNLSVFHKGCKVYTYQTDSNGRLREIRSITKSVTSMLIGIAIEKGFIQSIETPVHHFFPSAPNDLIIEDLLLMKSGFDIEDSKVSQCLIKSLNWIEDILNLDRTSEKYFRYKSVDYHLLSGIISKTTGMNAARFAQDYLFAPLGIEEFVWLEDPQGHSVGSTGLKLSHEALEKLGILCLEKGTWEGKRVLPSKWINRSTSPKIKTSLPYGAYGYGFWVKDYDGQKTYKALGAGGQQICNCPERNLSMIITANPKTHSHEKTEELTRIVL